MYGELAGGWSRARAHNLGAEKVALCVASQPRRA